MNTQLATQILIAERTVTGNPYVDSTTRLAAASAAGFSWRESFAGLIRSTAKGGLSLANRLDPTYQAA